jgi:hypothetical protein
MKVNILFKLKDGPTGGGNRFLKSLKQYLGFAEVYEDNMQKTDVILINRKYIQQITVEQVFEALKSVLEYAAV